MAKLILVKSVRVVGDGQALSTPRNLFGALKLLGIRVKRHRLVECDKEYLLFDAKASFRTLSRRYHSDLGGNDADMRCVLDAFRFVKAYCTRRPYTIPRNARYEERVVRQTFMDSL